MNPVSAFQWIDLLLLRPTLVIIAATLVVYACRNRSASTRHWLLYCFIGALPLLPALHWLLPNSPVEFLPADWHIIVTADTTTTDTATTPINWLLAGYLGITLFLLTRLLMGLRATHQLKRQLCPLEDAELLAIAADLQQAMNIDRTIELTYSERHIPPMAFGLIHPFVVLPKAILGRSNTELRAILTHEFAHIKRFDWLTSLLVKVICILFWFLPWLWWLQHHLAALAENACDDQVIEQGTADYRYAQTLIALAEDNSCHLAMAAFKKRAGLYCRISELLNERVSHSAPGRATKTAILIASVITLLPLATIQATTAHQVTPQITRHILAQRLPSPPFPETNPQSPLSTSVDLAPPLPTPKPKLPAFTTTNIAPITESTAVPINELDLLPPESFAQTSYIKRLPIEPYTIEPYQAIEKPSPRYPRHALKRGIEGSITVQYTIAEDGSVEDATIIEATPARVFDRAVLNALNKYRFQPQKVNGDAIAIHQVRNQFTFRLTDSSQKDPAKKRRRQNNANP